LFLGNWDIVEGVLLMSIDGTYLCEVKTPMGSMPVKMILTTDGDILGGSCYTQLGDRDITGTLPSPDEIAFSSKVKSPMGEVLLEVKAKISGSDITGQVKAGRFGTHPLKGKKA
jgi:hypothetical protein